MTADPTPAHLEDGYCWACSGTLADRKEGVEGSQLDLREDGRCFDCIGWDEDE